MNGAVRMLRVRLRDERGAVTLLVIGYCVLALAVIAVVGAATSLYLERKQLYTLADGAALHAAEAFDLASVQLLPEDAPVGSSGDTADDRPDGPAGETTNDLPSASGPRPQLQAELEPARVLAAARQFIAASDTAHFDSFELVDATTHDSRSAVVTLRSAWHPPILAFFLPEGLPIEVTARARTVFG